MMSARNSERAPGCRTQFISDLQLGLGVEERYSSRVSLSRKGLLESSRHIPFRTILLVELARL